MELWRFVMAGKSTNHRWSTMAAVAIVILTSSTVAGSKLTFNLPYGQRKCLREEIPGSSTVQGSVEVSSGRGDMTLDLFVTNMEGKVFFHKTDVNSMKYSFRTPGGTSVGAHVGDEYVVRGMYRFCVVNQVHPHAATTGDVTRRVTLAISYVTDRHQEEVSKLAKEDHAEKVFSSFSTVTSDVDKLIDRMDELRQREKELSQMNETTSRTIVSISVLACLFTILTGVLNFFSLKSFFKRKKLA